MRILLVAALALACNYNQLKNQGLEGAGGRGLRKLETFAAPDYATVNKFVIAGKCTECHASTGRREGGVALDSYALLRARLTRVLFRTMETPEKPMPPGKPLGVSELELLNNWAALGAPERVSANTEKPDPTLEAGPATFTKLRDRIFKSKCLDCHQQPNPEGALDLTSLSETRAKAMAIFDRVIVKGDMPYEPYPVMTPAERRVLLKWFNTGMPE